MRPESPEEPGETISCGNRWSRPSRGGIALCGAGCAEGAGPRPQDVHRRDALARHRTVPRRTHQGDYRRPGRPERLLHRRGERRRVEDNRLRPHVDADLRRPAHRLDRIDRRRGVRSRHRVRRERRRARAARPVGRRRDLQVDRRRPDVDASRPPRRPADPVHHRRSAKRESALRRRAGTSVRAE